MLCQGCRQWGGVLQASRPDCNQQSKRKTVLCPLFAQVRQSQLYNSRSYSQVRETAEDVDKGVGAFCLVTVVKCPDCGQGWHCRY